MVSVAQRYVPSTCHGTLVCPGWWGYCCSMQTQLQMEIPDIEVEKELNGHCSMKGIFNRCHTGYDKLGVAIPTYLIGA